MRNFDFRVCCIPLLLLANVGCGGGGASGDRNPTVPVSGTATLDGKPYGPGKIEFISTAVGEHARVRNGLATVESGGSFVAGSYEEDDGLAPGTYQVHLMPDSEDPTSVHIAIEDCMVTVPEGGASDLKVEMVSSMNAGNLDLLNSNLNSGGDTTNLGPRL